MPHPRMHCNHTVCYKSALPKHPAGAAVCLRYANAAAISISSVFRYRFAEAGDGETGERSNRGNRSGAGEQQTHGNKPNPDTSACFVCMPHQHGRQAGKWGGIWELGAGGWQLGAVMALGHAHQMTNQLAAH